MRLLVIDRYFQGLVSLHIVNLVDMTFLHISLF